MARPQRLAPRRGLGGPEVTPTRRRGAPAPARPGSPRRRTGGTAGQRRQHFPVPRWVPAAGTRPGSAPGPALPEFPFPAEPPPSPAPGGGSSAAADPGGAPGG